MDDVTDEGECGTVGRNEQIEARGGVADRYCPFLKGCVHKLGGCSNGRKMQLLWTSRV